MISGQRAVSNMGIDLSNDFQSGQVCSRLAVSARTVDVRAHYINNMRLIHSSHMFGRPYQVYRLLDSVPQEAKACHIPGDTNVVADVLSMRHQSVHSQQNGKHVVIPGPMVLRLET